MYADFADFQAFFAILFFLVALKLARIEPSLQHIDNLAGLFGRRELKLRLRAVFAILFLEPVDAGLWRTPLIFAAIPLGKQEHDGRPSALGEHFFVELSNDLLPVSSV